MNKIVKLRPFDEIIKENGHTSCDAGGNWSIYHPDVTKCLTLLSGHQRYFDSVVTVWPNEKVNTIISRSHDTHPDRRVYKAETASGVIFDVYNHWFTDVIDHFPEELFDI